MKEFNPIRLSKGEFQISLNLTSLGVQAWDTLKLAEQLGFPNPQFYGFNQGGTSKVWAVLVQESHDFETSSLEEVLEVWESKVDQLAQSLPVRNENLLIAGRFKRDKVAA